MDIQKSFPIDKKRMQYIEERLKKYLETLGEFVGIHHTNKGPIDLYEINDATIEKKLPVGIQISHGEFDEVWPYPLSDMPHSCIIVSLPEYASEKLVKRIKKKVGWFSSMVDEGNYSEEEISQWPTLESIKKPD